MELKQRYGNIYLPNGKRFNRTSVELKRQYDDVIKLARQWFNRTSVELKPIVLYYKVPYTNGLIVPVWN